MSVWCKKSIRQMNGFAGWVEIGRITVAAEPAAGGRQQEAECLMEEQRTYSRRRFLSQAAGAAAISASFPYIIPSAALAVASGQLTTC